MVALRDFFSTISTPALALGQPITKFTLAILVGHAHMLLLHLCRLLLEPGGRRRPRRARARSSSCHRTMKMKTTTSRLWRLRLLRPERRLQQQQQQHQQEQQLPRGGAGHQPRGRCSSHLRRPRQRHLRRPRQRHPRRLLAHVTREWPVPMPGCVHIRLYTFTHVLIS